MSAYYDLFEKPDVRQTGEQQSLYARFVPKGTIDRKEFIERVHLFTGLSRSLLEGAMAGFMDELRDCLANGWTVELGELGYFTPCLLYTSCHRARECQLYHACFHVGFSGGRGPYTAHGHCADYGDYGAF